MGFLANLFGYLLNYLYMWLQNYGWAIIIFSVILQIVLLPLSIKQQKSLKKSAKIQQEMQKLQVKYKNNQEIFLTSMEYKILLILATNPNVVFTREKMLADIWDVNEEYVNDNTLTVYIKRLREKIEDDPNHPKIIETVRGVGYKIGDPS